MLVTGSFIGSNVIGHLMLIRSEATARSSSLSAACLPAAAADLPVLGSEESRDRSENHVDECGMGGASSPGN